MDEIVDNQLSASSEQPTLSTTQQVIDALSKISRSKTKDRYGKEFKDFVAKLIKDINGNEVKVSRGEEVVIRVLDSYTRNQAEHQHPLRPDEVIHLLNVLGLTPSCDLFVSDESNDKRQIDFLMNHNDGSPYPVTTSNINNKNETNRETDILSLFINGNLVETKSNGRIISRLHSRFQGVELQVTHFGEQDAQETSKSEGWFMNLVIKSPITPQPKLQS